MQSRRGRGALLLGGPLLVLALSTCTAVPPAAVTATDPPRVLPAVTEPAVTEPPVTAVDPPRRDRDSVPRTPVAATVDEAPPAAETAPPEPAAEPAPPPAPAPPPPPASVVATPEEPPPAAVTVAQPTRVVVPRIGVNHPLVPVGLNPDRTLFVPDDAHVAGWYTGAPRPGQTGPSIVLGHNTWKGSQGVFWDLHRLAPGDVVEVAYDDGAVVRFAVERVEQHAKDAFPTERVYGNTPRREIRVITCGGPFDRQLGAQRDNVIVFGVLIP